MDGRHADGVFMPPVHAGLFAAARDEHAHGGLDVPGCDVAPLFPEPAVAHVVLALLKVEQVLRRVRRGVQFLLVEPPEAFHGALRAVPEEKAAAEAVFPLRLQREAAGVEVIGGVGEVVGEQGVGEGVAEGVSGRSRPSPSCPPIPHVKFSDRITGLQDSTHQGNRVKKAGVFSEECVERREEFRPGTPQAPLRPAFCAFLCFVAIPIIQVFPRISPSHYPRLSFLIASRKALCYSPLQIHRPEFFTEISKPADRRRFTHNHSFT
jgi:hypothetical protein